MLDRQAPGFTEKYLNALLDAGDLGAYAAVRTLSSRDDRAAVLTLLGENAGLFAKLELAVSGMVKKQPNDIWVEQIVQVCLDTDPSYAASLVKGLCAGEALCSYEEVDLIAGALWGSKLTRDCVQVAMHAAMSLEDNDWYSSHNAVELCEKITELAPDEDIAEWFLPFLVENAFREGGEGRRYKQRKRCEECERPERYLARSIAGAASELPTKDKLNYVQQLCQKGLKPENLHAVVTDPNGVTSWSGREDDFIETKIRFWENFIDQLDIAEFAEIRQAARGIVDRLEIDKAQAAAREMARGW